MQNDTQTSVNILKNLSLASVRLHSTTNPTAKEVKWLPTASRMNAKVLSLAFKALPHLALINLSRLISYYCPA